MIGQTVTSKDGNPIDSGGTKLSESTYQPSEEVMKLFARCQRDYQVAYTLQHRPFDEFDGYSLLQRAKRDQETFGAYVGAEYVPQHKRWRWRGRKNTARNKLMGILAHMLVAMLFPYVHAVNERNEEDRMTARVMALLVENHLKKAGYEMKFLYILLSALVNPAVFVGVEYVMAFQRVKSKLKTGEIEVIEAVDELLSGLQLNIIPVDELLLGDFYTGDMQRQPYLIRVRRIPYDQAREIYGEHNNFKFVEAGKTRVVLAGNENQTLFDIEWTEADRNYVQELTFFYRTEDLEVTFVGGVFMGDEENIYNSNQFKHRRLVPYEDTWISIPIYEFAKSGFEPIDPTGRFAYYKSGAFKEFWDDASQNAMHRILHDGTYLDVIKPIFLSGVAKVDGIVLAPGAAVGMPTGASATPYNLGPNLAAATNMMNIEKDDMSESTQDKILQGSVEAGVTAYATSKAEQNARIMLGVFGNMIAGLVKDVGELTMDCVIQHTTVGEFDASVPDDMIMKYKTVVLKGKEKGKNVTNRIVFTDKFMGKEMTKAQQEKYEWKLYDQAGGEDSDQRIYETNPYRFARTSYTMWVDPDQIIQKGMGTQEQRDILAFQMMTDPRVVPYTDQEAVIQDFVIEKFSNGDPARYQNKSNNVDQMMAAVMGNNQGQEGMPPVPMPQAATNQGSLV